MNRFSYQKPGEAEAVLKQALALLDLFQGVADPAAELARLRGIEKVYAAAAKECKWWRQLTGDYSASPNTPGWYHHDGKGWFHSDEADAHDTARAEAGMEAL